MFSAQLFLSILKIALTSPQIPIKINLILLRLCREIKIPFYSYRNSIITLTFLSDLSKLISRLISIGPLLLIKYLIRLKRFRDKSLQSTCHSKKRFNKINSRIKNWTKCRRPRFNSLIMMVMMMIFQHLGYKINQIKRIIFQS